MSPPGRQAEPFFLGEGELTQLVLIAHMEAKQVEQTPSDLQRLVREEQVWRAAKVHRMGSIIGKCMLVHRSRVGNATRRLAVAVRREACISPFSSLRRTLPNRSWALCFAREWIALAAPSTMLSLPSCAEQAHSVSIASQSR